MTRDIWVKWEEPYRDDEIVHQLEHGQRRPYHKRSGLVLQFIKDVSQLRSGILESKTEAVILDIDNECLIVKPLTAVKFAYASLPRFTSGTEEPVATTMAIKDIPRSPTNFSDTPYLSG